MDVLGIDPGLSGAVARFNGARLIVEDIPSVEAAKRGNDLNYDGLRDLMNIMFAGAEVAYIEDVHAMPKQGVSSTFKFGKGFGAVIMAVAFLEIPRFMISPMKWKMEMGLNSDKEKSRKRALEMFPSEAHLFGRKKDNGRAEAALIAWYGYRMQTVGRIR
jgi:hypothetical protein